MNVTGLDLKILAGAFAVSRLPADAPFPEWAQGALLSLTRTPEELSVVSAVGSVPESVRSERGWRALQVEGPLEFSLVGILATLSETLAEAEVPIFALSTFDTDYLLVRGQDLSRAVRALESAGHQIAPT